MLIISSTDRATSAELVAQLKSMNEEARNDQRRDYILKPCPEKRENRKIELLEAEVDDKVRELTLKDTRTRLSQRFYMHPSSPRRSIRIRVPSLRMHISQGSLYQGK